jgi:hypothetical protein
VSTPSDAEATIAGSSSASQAASQAYGSTLVFTCSAGYSGSLTYTCGQNGQFATSDSACAAVTCDGRTSAVAVPSNAEATIASSSTASQAASQAYGSTLVFTCSAGYSGSLTYTCGIGGFVSGDSCPATPPFVPPTSGSGSTPGKGSSNALSISDGCIIALSGLPTSMTLTVKDSLFLAVAAVHTCIVQPVVRYSWTILSGNSLPAEFNASSPVLSFAPYSLSPGRVALQVSVFNMSGTRVIHATVTVVVRPLPLFARITGGSRTVKSSVAVLLDASQSFDYNVEPTARPSDKLLTFMWTCTHAAAACQAGIFAANSTSTQSRLYLLPLAASVAPYNFTVSVSKSGMSTITTSVLITALECGPVINIAQASVPKFNTNTKIALRATARSLNDATTEWNWDVLREGVKLNLSAGMVSTRLMGVDKGSFGANLVVRPNMLQAGQNYVFQLSASSSACVDIAHGKILVQMNDSPRGGTLAVSPAGGQAIGTLFHLESAGWIDDDAAEGLRYSFTFHMGNSHRGYLRDFAHVSDLHTVLPQGPTATSRIYSLRVVVMDVFGATGSSNTSVSVDPPQLQIVVDSVSQLLASVNQSTVETYSHLQCVSAALTASPMPISTREIAEARQVRSILIDTVASLVAVSLSEPIAVVPESFSRLGQSLADMTETPWQLTVTSAGRALDALNQLVSAGQTLQYAVDGAAAAASNLFGALDDLHAQPSVSSSASRRRTLATDTSAAEMGRMGEAIVDAIGNTLVNQNIEGENPVLLTTPQFAVEVARDTRDNLEGTVLGGGIVRVPTGALAVAAQHKSVSSQVVSYNGTGPLFFTPTTLDDGTQAVRASGVTSVSFKRTVLGTDAGALGLGTAGAEVPISNLTEPFLIRLDSSSRGNERFSSNLGNMTLAEVDRYISLLWNRTSLAREAQDSVTNLSMTYEVCKQYFTDANFSAAMAVERAEVRRRADQDGVHCPAKPDSCDAAQLKEKNGKGCPGVRGGAEDCAKWPAACDCLRTMLRVAYTQDKSQCTFWDESAGIWREDGTVMERADTHVLCAFAHLTSFSSFVGPAPSFNRMSIKGMFSKEW